VTLFFPRLMALRRGREEAGWRRLAALSTLGALFWIGSYAITARVLRHFATVDPDLGRILAAKLLALLFLLLLTFLTFSALITAISQCFLARDLPLVIAAPIPLRRLFRAKLVEVGVYASWTAIFLALPVFVAYGVVFEAGIRYYLTLVLVITPFAMMAAGVGILLSVALVNLFPARRARDLLSLVALVLLIGIVFLLRVMRPEQFVRPESFGTWAEYLVSLSNPTLPWLPSYWASRVLGEVLGIYQVTHWPAVAWYGALLCASALVTTGLAAGVFREGFRTGWSRAQEARQVRWTRKEWWTSFLSATCAPFPPRQRAIILKDAMTIFRDPAQWSQLVLLLAVVAVYLYNINVLPLDRAGGTGYFMRNLLAFLNVGLVGLVVAALAARFVLPGVSLEGSTLWLLRASPLPVRELLWAKFWGGFLPLVLVAELLVVLTNTMLQSTSLLQVLSMVAVLCLAAAITGLGVGLGAAHPRFDAADGTQVAAGYAGFLFMVLSALLVLFSVTVLAWPVYHSFRATWFGWGVGPREWLGMTGGLVAVAGISAIALYAAIRTGCERMAVREES
jgi:ABC-2 type transport system permease protein